MIALPFRRRRLRPSGLRASVAANVLGNGLSAIAALVSVPIVLHFLGLEQYGLVGFYTSLLGLVAVIDAGLNRTLNRSLASLSTRPDSAGQMRDTLRTLESVYWVGSGLLCVLVVGFSRLAGGWFVKASVSPSTVETAVALMGVAIALQFPFALYTGGLLGMRHQVLQNVINVFFVLMGTLGSIVVLWLISPTIEAYLIWQILTNLAKSVTVGIALWRVLPYAPTRPRPRLQLWREQSSFAAGSWAVNVSFVILLQGPRIIASRMLTLREFGFYSVAFVAASGMYFLSVPVTAAVFPRLTQLVELNQTRQLRDLFHRSSQLMSALALPLAATLAFLAPQALLAWTGSPGIVTGTRVVLGLLVIGTAFQQLFAVPLALQFAKRRTRLPVLINWAGIAILIPLTIWATASFGATGTAASWLAVTFLFLIAGVPPMLESVIPRGSVRWLTADILPAALVSGLAGLALRLVLPYPHNRLIAFIEIVAGYALVFLMASAVLPAPRQWLLEVLTLGRRMARAAIPIGQRA